MLWNQFDTKGKDGMTCEVIDIKGWNGDTINAYVARPGARLTAPASSCCTTCPAGTSSTARRPAASRSTAT